MELTRRHFLGKSLAGAAGIFLSGPMNSQAENLPIQNGNLLFGFSTPSTVLDEARKNIPKIRQRETRIQFLDKWGKPLSNRDVEIKQLSHQFLFGDNNWSMSAMVRNGMGGTDRLKYYRKRFEDVLNSLNTTVYWTERPRNDAAKTEDFQGEIQLDDFEESVNWANAHGLTVKGHPMYWTVPKAIPEWLAKYPYETHMKFAEVRIRNLAARFKNRVKIWDAVNEMLWEPHPKNLDKRVWPYRETMENMVDYIGKVLTWAREEDPNALYTINDYGLSAARFGEQTSHDGKIITPQIQRKRYIELVHRLGDVGVPPNLMGVQCHTGWITPSEQMSFFDEMSSAGIPITVTEFWANTDELKNKAQNTVEGEEWKKFAGSKKYEDINEKELEELRDRYVLDFLTCAFAHPNIDSFYFWGFIGMTVKFLNERNSAHEMQPLYYKVKDLIHNQWTTKLKLKTDENGLVVFRGFCGNYTALIEPTKGVPIGNTFQIDKNREMNNITIKTIL